MDNLKIRFMVFLIIGILICSIAVNAETTKKQGFFSKIGNWFKGIFKKPVQPAQNAIPASPTQAPTQTTPTNAPQTPPSQAASPSVPSTQTQSAPEKQEPMPSVYSINVEGETGKLEGVKVYTKIGASSRGPGELYLGDGGSSSKYSFDSLYSGKMLLYVRISDDALHQSGTRSILFTINGKGYNYNHISENTICNNNFWAWRHIGQVDVVKGTNNAIITKPQTTSAAFVMDKFQLNTKQVIQEPACCNGITDELGQKCRARNYNDWKAKIAAIPYYTSCTKADAWFKGTSGKKSSCDASYQKCYELCANKKMYLVCDMMCSDSGWESCFSSCNPDGFNSACDLKCD